MHLTKYGTNIIILLVEDILSPNMSLFMKNASYLTHPKSQGEKINDLESYYELFTLGPNLPIEYILVLTPELGSISVHSLCMSYVLQESMHSTQTLVYQRRSKPNLL